MPSEAARGNGRLSVLIESGRDATEHGVQVSAEAVDDDDDHNGDIPAAIRPYSMAVALICHLQSAKRGHALNSSY